MWDGRQWVPASPALAATAGSGRNLALIVGGLAGLVVVLGICGMGVCALALQGGGSGGGPTGDITGTYTLKEMDGRKLPAGDPQRFLFDGRLELRADGTYTLRFSWQGQTGAMRYTGDDGTYKRSGSSLSFTAGNGPAFSGQLGDRSVVLAYDFSGTGKPQHFLFTR